MELPNIYPAIPLRLVSRHNKEALKVLNKWYKAEYIDPEFIMNTRDVQRSKWSEGMFGYIEDAAGWV